MLLIFVIYFYEKASVTIKKKCYLSEFYLFLLHKSDGNCMQNSKTEKKKLRRHVYPWSVVSVS